MLDKTTVPTVGLFGFGAFGRLIATHLHAHVRLAVCDPVLDAIGQDWQGLLQHATVAEAAGCDIVILAVPVADLAACIRDMRPHLRPGAVVIDVGSVKVKPTATMLGELPSHVDILGTHPLFGPQSAKDGIAGFNIALCPVRGRAVWRIAAFLRHVLRLRVFITSPETHDREAAVVQGLTHLIAKVLLAMGPMPSRLTTASFERLMEAAEMVRHDSPGVFLAIERDNPFAAQVRNRFFALADEVREELEAGAPTAEPERSLHASYP